MSWGHAFYVLCPFHASYKHCCSDCKRGMRDEIVYWNCKKGNRSKHICVNCFATRTLRGVMKYGGLPQNWGRCDAKINYDEVYQQEEE